MTSQYNHKQIESNWKQNWFENNVYKAVDFSPKPKKYILAELPYPSGEFLHVGHTMRYTVPDVYARYLRMKGFNVLYPMGWDSFGLPTEGYAIKTGMTPQEVIAKASVSFKKALQDMGYSIDWDREVNTSDPSYYKWTQWTFLKLWKAGLAEKKEMPVWWCKELGVLADEEVLTDKDGNKISERGGHKVDKRNFSQWVLKIPEYADRLIKDLDLVDYNESIKTMQKNWIGKSEGATVKFEVYYSDENLGELEVFTTRPDTLFGVTYMAIAPEHKLLDVIKERATNKDEIEAYIAETATMKALDRQIAKGKTGVKLADVYVKHPLKEITTEIPLFIADYVLMDYGTGAIMGVPAHDERDKEFAVNHGVEIVDVLNEENVMINSGEYSGLDSTEFFNIIINRLESENLGKKAVTYKMRNQIFSRQRYWGEPIPLIYTQGGKVESIVDPNNMEAVNKTLPLELPIMADFLPPDTGEGALSKNPEWCSTVDSNGNPAKRETDTMPTWAGSNWYYVRYIDPKNNEEFADMDKLKYWMPVDKYFGDSGHTTVHLLYSRFWYKFLFDQGVVPHSEPYKWRMSGGLLLGPDGTKMSKSKGNVINPKDVIDNYGADALRTYLCFIGPYEDTFPWNENGIRACWRLLKNIYEMSESVTDVSDKEVVKAYNKLVKNVSQMCEDLKMNTSVSEIMIFVNKVREIGGIGENEWKGFIKVIAPFAPFLAEELWQTANKYEKWTTENTVHFAEWPSYDENALAEDNVEMPVQINGKIKGYVSVPTNSSEADVTAIVKSNEKLGTLLSAEPKKVIFVPNKIINFVL